MEENRFYVYAYLREDGTPYYIGKGSGGRMYAKNRSCRQPNDPNRMVKLYDCLSEPDAFAMERLGISLFGRLDLDTGCLRNLTDGGDGTSGRRMSDEHKKRISEANGGRVVSETHKRNLSLAQQRRWLRQEERDKMANRPISDATREKMILSHIGKKQSPETVAKRVAKTRGKKRTSEFRERMRAMALARHHSKMENSL